MSKTKKDNEHQTGDLLENPEALAEQLSRTEQFIEKNKTLASIVVGVIAVVIVGFVGSKYYFEGQNQNAQRDLFQAVYYFESDSLGLALNGDGNNYGFLEIMDEYGMTEASNLANYYAGATYLKLGDYDNALKYLNSFSASDYMIQSRAYALIGDANMELGDYATAASSYEKAANNNANDEFSHIYLSKAALANEKSGNTASAISNYNAIVEDYPKSQSFQDARKHIARLEGSSK